MPIGSPAAGVDAPAFPYPVALCDIGGTNVRLAEVAAAGAPVRSVTQLGTGDHADLAAAISSQASAFSAPPRSLIVCAAGPVAGRQVKLTNARWTVDGPRTAEALRLEQGLLLNDFEAQAIMLTNLRPDATLPIGEVRSSDGDTDGGGTRLVLGPGTGLGVGLLIAWQGRFLPLMTEAGHTDFGTASALDRDIWRILQRTSDRITGETLLSGPGTVRLYKALCELEGTAPTTDDAATITQTALHAPDGIEARTLRLFWTLVARFAGGLALGLLAKGGVTLSGGILKRITTFLDPAAFRRAFEDQAPLQHVVARIPVDVVMDDHCVLDGLGGLANTPARFMIDYPNRLWR